jgi:molybdenum cofactor biosynthesis enzyme MoaA
MNQAMRLASSHGVEFPRLVSVETTNHCNAKCIFCPNNALARDKGPMDDDLFEKIIEDCRAFPLEAIEPFLQGDPFSDPQILPRLELIRRRLPRTKLRLYTNGYGMSPKKIDAMRELGMDHLFVSINTLDAKKYRDVMGVPIERTLRNMDYLTQPRVRQRIAGKITFRMTRLSDTTLEEQEEFVRYCRARGVRSFIVGLFNYKGDINSRLPVPSYGCEHVHRLDILASGRITLCCMDQDGEYGWGDARESSVLELYNHARARHYRELHAGGRRREIDPCGTCNNFWPGFYELTPMQAIRAGVEYCTYMAKHRPVGRRAPERVAGDDSLLQLKLRHDSAATPKRARSSTAS